MWIAIVFVVAFLLMAALMPKPNVENARAAKLGDFQFPRSKYGDPMPLVWGTVRQKSPITAWFGDFRPVPIRKKMKTGLLVRRKLRSVIKTILALIAFCALAPAFDFASFGPVLTLFGKAT
ncbi:tail assembly chaperone [Pseudomonas phage PSA-KC1]